MRSSLCVVLPVRNAQSQLAQQVEGLLEILPETATRFELLVIDNGSTDATPDVAHELESRFPQVRTLRLGTPAEAPAVIRLALRQTAAEMVLLCDEGCRLELQDFHKLWTSRNDYDAVLAWPPNAGAVDEKSYGQRVRAWRLRLARPAAASASTSVAGYQLVHRRVLEKLRWIARDRYELLAELSRHAFRWQVVEVRPAKTAAMAAAERSGARFDDRGQPLSGPSSAKRSRRLEAIKAFTLGE